MGFYYEKCNQGDKIEFKLTENGLLQLKTRDLFAKLSQFVFKCLNQILLTTCIHKKINFPEILLHCIAKYRFLKFTKKYLYYCECQLI